MAGVSRDLCASWSGHQLGPSLGLLTPAGQTDAGNTRSPTAALLLGLGLRPSLGLEDQADEWWGQLSRTSSPPLTSRLEEPAQDSAEAVGLEALVTSSLIWAPPVIPDAASWSSRDGGAALTVPKDLEIPLTTPPDDSLHEVSL